MAKINRIPVMKVGENLLVSIQVDMTDEMAIELQQDILNRLVETSASGVLIDISTLDMMDSFLARAFSETSRMAATMNAIVVIVGIQPAIALTLVELGLKLPDVHTALNVDRGMELLESIKRESQEV
jgi:rsbT antagonist protein RsbS